MVHCYVSSNPIHSEVYSIQHYVIGRWVSPVSSINKTVRQDITEILLKVALNTINLKKTKPHSGGMYSIQHYVIKFVSYLSVIFSWVLSFPPQ